MRIKINYCVILCEKGTNDESLKNIWWCEESILKYFHRFYDNYASGEVK